MSWSEQAWVQVTDVVDEIREHPFVRALQDGSLPGDVFDRYLVDDAHYLVGYARALALVASRLPEASDVGRWAGFAQGAVLAERQLHAEHLASRGLHPTSSRPTPTGSAYTGHLLAHAASSPVEVAVAATLPCFRVYLEVGRSMLPVDDEHPYADWIATYADDAFAESVRQAEDTADRLALAAPHLVPPMHEAYRDATRLEWRFWDAAWRGETAD